MQLEEIMVVHVSVKGNEVTAFQGEAGGVVMIPFDATIDGKYFNGTVLPGGIDTQVFGPHGTSHTLSARYMATGKDYTGEDCFVTSKTTVLSAMMRRGRPMAATCAPPPSSSPTARRLTS